MKGKIKMVADHLKQYGSITSMDAFEKYGCTRLSAQIFNLKNDYGWIIETEDEKGVDRFGNSVNYARYRYIDDGTGDPQLSLL